MNDEVVITNLRVLEWVNQFAETDRKFILEELLHLLSKGVYFSRNNAKEFISNMIIFLTKEYNYMSPTAFLEDTVFLDVQGAHKSQHALLDILDEVITDNYGFGLKLCGVK